MDRRLQEPEMRRLLERADHPQSERVWRDRTRSNLHDVFVEILEEILNDAITSYIILFTIDEANCFCLAVYWRILLMVKFDVWQAKKM